MAGSLTVEIVSPSGRVFRGEASGVQAPGVQGSFEILFNHAPMIAAFEIGSLAITTASGERFAYATSGGFIEVLDNRVTVLAETAEPATEIDVERAQQAEQRAIEALAHATTEERAEIERALERARSRLRVAMGSVGTRQ